MNKGRLAAALISVAVLVGFLVYGSRRVTEVECSLCVTFQGQTECRRGSGATAEDAQSAAQRAACAVMTSGMAESVNCSNVPPTNLQCPL